MYDPLNQIFLKTEISENFPWGIKPTYSRLHRGLMNCNIKKKKKNLNSICLPALHIKKQIFMPTAWCGDHHFTYGYDGFIVICRVSSLSHMLYCKQAQMFGFHLITEPCSTCLPCLTCEKQQMGHLSINNSFLVATPPSLQLLACQHIQMDWTPKPSNSVRTLTLLC